MSYIKDGVGCSRTFWVNTGNDALQRQLLSIASDDIRDKFRSLISENTPITVELSDMIRFEDVNTDEKAFWALLYASGYLTAVEPLQPIRTHYEGEVKIPNFEIQGLYVDVLNNWLSKEVLSKIPGSSLKIFYRAVQEGNADKLGRWLGDFLVTHTSHHQLTTESSYHVLLLGLAAGLVDSHFVWSEPESGDDRPDLMLVPKSEKICDLAWIFEFKRLPKTPGRKTPQTRQLLLEELAQKAVEQITENRYQAKLAALPHVKRILKIGMAFGGKQVVWRLMTTPKNTMPQ